MAAGRLLPLLLLLLGGVRGVPPPEPPPANTALDDRCRLPALTGRCRASIPRWFFNASTGTCERFVFGGCGGNGNNFGSERECREGCGGVPERALDRPNSTLAERCSAPPVTGPCRASFVRWYFIPAENSCREFTYGGCRGNGNNHPDREECLRRCRPHAGDPSAEFRRFLATKGLVLGGLLAAGAALGFGIRAGLRLLRRKRDLPGSGSGSKIPRDDTECLMKDDYTV